MRFIGKEGRKCVFNDAFNIFYLWLYGVKHMVKDHSDSKRGNPLLPHVLLFPISSKGFFYMHHPTQDSTYHRLCYTSRVHAGTRNRLVVHHEGLIRWPITPWADTYPGATSHSPSSQKAVSEWSQNALAGWFSHQERNVLFNDTLNTFYLRLYGITHMVKDHSDSERGNPLPPHRLLFPISSKGSFICHQFRLIKVHHSPVIHEPHWCLAGQKMTSDISSHGQSTGITRERNVLFNDALNTFYQRLYGVRHMVTDHSDSEKGNPLTPHRLLLLINSKGSFICTIPQTG